MRMLTDPRRQSANQTASRSDLSSNWRTKIDSPPSTGNNAATWTPGPPSKPDYIRQRDSWSKSKDTKENDPEQLISRETSRGENDPDTLQAIAEGRRLYVGNLPYMAKTRDVEMLFGEDDYRM